MMALHAGPEGHEPGHLGDDLVGSLRWSEDDDTGTRRVDGLGERGQVLVPDDAVVELADVVGEDAPDDLVGVDDADDDLVDCRALSVMAQAPASGAGGDEVRRR